MTESFAGGILATADQDTIEIRASQIYRSDAFLRQIDATRTQYAADPMATSPDGAATLDNAVAELAWAVALVGANVEPEHPRIGWVYTAPRNWRGRSIPGSRWAVDNPDNVYRIAPVDGRSAYEIDVTRHGAGPIQFSLMILSHFVGEDGHEQDADRPLGGLLDTDVSWTSTDAFTITIDPDPANGRPNHIQSTPEARQLLIRNTLGDWDEHLPLEMAIRRVGGPPPAAPLSDEQVAHRSATLLEAAGRLSLAWKKKALFGHWSDNMLCQPYGRGGQWGFAASGNFKLGPDEALIVTIDPLDAQYVGFTLTDPWLASLNHVDRSGSLSTQQSTPNEDGSYTYVIAPGDPGVHNWLDSSGLHDGSMLVRWQALSASRTAADGAVRDVCRVRLDELAAALPAGTRMVTATERSRILQQRAAGYARRYSASQ